MSVRVSTKALIGSNTAVHSLKSGNDNVRVKVVDFQYRSFFASGPVGVYDL